MSNSRFAKLHDGLIVRKGDARPAIAPSVPGISFVDDIPVLERAVKSARSQITRPIQLVSEQSVSSQDGTDDVLLESQPSPGITQEPLNQHQSWRQELTQKMSTALVGHPGQDAPTITSPEPKKPEEPREKTSRAHRIFGTLRKKKPATASDIKSESQKEGRPTLRGEEPAPDEIGRSGPSTRAEALTSRPPKRREVLDVPLTDKEFEDLCSGTCTLADDEPLPPGKYRFVIRLDAEQRRRVRILAAKKNISNQEVIAAAIDNYLEEISAGPMSRCGCMQARKTT